MANRRSDEKFFIGAYVREELAAGVEIWCQEHLADRTRFITEAAFEKLRREGIEVPEEALSRTRPRRKPRIEAFQKLKLRKLKAMPPTSKTE